MRKLLFLIFAYLISSSTSKAQVIDNNLNGLSIMKNVIKSKVDAKKILLFSILVSVDKQGKIDSVFFSDIKEPWILENEIETKPIINFFKTKNKAFQAYPNSIIILPIIMRNGDEIQATYLDALSFDFGNLYSVPEKYKNKRVVINKPQKVIYVVDY